MRLKVCGMRDHDNIMAVAALQPDYMGFIFYEKSPRYVGEDFVLPRNFPSTVKKVGVFVNESTERIAAQIENYNLDYVQLHGSESVDQLKALSTYGVKIIKVFSVGEDFDFATTLVYEEFSDYFLFDTKGKYFGGNAQAFDWQILKQYNNSIPFFLSGGLTPDNVGDIQTLQGLNLHALDINSGVELSAGIKDVTRIKKVLERMDIINEKLTNR